jgi:hypothetical protein
VSGDAKTQPGFADSAQIGGFQIFLSEMYAVGLMLNRQLPVIVNEQPGVIAAAKGDGGDHVILHLAVASVFDAQLKGTYSSFEQALNPRHAVHHRVESETKRDGWKIRLIHQASSCFR